MASRVHYSLLLSFIVFWTTACQRAGDPVLVQNTRDVGNYNWHYDRLKTLDLNCDGKLDFLIPGYIKESNRYILAGFLGPKGPIMKFSVVDLGLNSQEQDSFCGANVTLAPEALTPVAVDDDGEIPPPKGYRPDLCPNGFYLTDNQCDAFHFYWDHDRNRLEWFRN